MDIKDYLTEPEILAQLAEEAAELAQAALKLRRVLDGTNPTPVTEEDARENLLEEMADVSLCNELLFSWDDYERAVVIAKEKQTRWLARLEERQ